MTRRRWLTIAALSAAIVAIPAAAADFPIRLVSQTSTTITLGWDRQANVAAYTFYANGKRVSHTFDGARVSVTFAKVTGCVTACYGVEDLISGGIDTYPEPPIVGGQVFVSTTGNDQACSRGSSSSPCASFDRAYAIALLGDTVIVAAGNYVHQTITEKGDKSAPGLAADVVFRPAQGATVRLAGLQLGESCCGATNNGPDHITIENMTESRGVNQATQWVIGHDSNDITFRNIDASNFYVNSARDILIDGGDWGPCNVDQGSCLNSKISQEGDLYRTERVTVQDAVFHDYRINSGSSSHFECMFLVGGQNITIRRNKFYNCDFFDIFVQYYQDLNFPRLSYNPHAGLRIENNWFAQPFDGRDNLRTSAVHFDDGWQYGFENVLVRYNSAYNSYIDVCGDGIGSSPCSNGNRNGGGNHNVQFSNVRVIGNITNTQGACYSGVSFGRNLRVGGGLICGAGDINTGSYPYVNPISGAAMDYNLTAGAVAINQIPETSPDFAIPDDLARQTRPVGPARDIGADERG